MKNLLLVGVGGFLGSSARYLTGVVVARTLPGSQFPWTTLVVNVAGSFAIGAVAARASEITPEARLFIVTGVLGGFTTYSAFAYETVSIGRAGLAASAMTNVGLQLALGLSAVWLGLRLGAPGAN